MPIRARKAPTNLSVRVDLVQRAKVLEINLSRVLEAALEAAIKDKEREIWLESNRDAIDRYNAAVEQRGVFSDSWRRF